MKPRKSWVLVVGIAVLAVGFTIAARFRSSQPAADVPVGGPQAVPVTPVAQTEGTQRMAQRLADLARNSNVDTNGFLNERRVQQLQAMTLPTDPARRLEHDLKLGFELLAAGRTAESIPLLEDACKRLDAVPVWRDSPIGIEAHSMLATAHLRAGEQENCIRHHGTESCLLPIRGNGIHRVQDGSRAAIRELEARLSRHPDDLRSRWLINIAYMTVGEWPDKVPEAWRIPPSAFESDYDVKRFPDVASKTGLDVSGLAGAGIMDDFDGDGYLDVFVTSWGLTDPMHLFRNERDGTFRELTEEAGLAGIVSGLNAVHADYDNDGDLDLFVPRGAWIGENGMLPPSLLRNRGNGVFDDVTEEAGLLMPRPSQTAAWGDYDNDGFVDLFTGAESAPRGPAHPTGLYHNNGDGTFTDVARDVGVDVVAFVKGSNWGDYDNDGLLDLYVTVLHKGVPSNKLFHNGGRGPDGKWKFTDVADQAGVRKPSSSFPTWFFDYDNDGWLDLFVSSYDIVVSDIAADVLGIGKPREGQTPRLYRNQRDGTFRDVTREAGMETVLMTMGCNFGDLDNDGWLDFYIGTGNPDYRSLVPNRMFRNAGGRKFQDVTTSGGFGHLQKSHGVGFGDIDNDGDQDVFLKVGGAFTGDSFQSALFENPGHGNHWITLRLIGVETNRAAIGARIKVTVEEAGAPRDVHVTVTSGSSFGGNSLRQEIGLGGATRIRRLEIHWPTSGRRQTFENVAMDQMLEIREDADAPRPIHLDRITLGG
jgi:hypothetical protein